MATQNWDTKLEQLTIALKSTTVEVSNTSSWPAVQLNPPCESVFWLTLEAPRALCQLEIVLGW